MAVYGATAEQIPLPVWRNLKGGRVAEEDGPPYGAGGADDGPAPEQHGRIPDSVLYCADLPIGARLLYAALQRQCGGGGECFPSVRTLADKLGVSTRSVTLWRRALEERGFLCHEQGGGRRSNRYTLTPRPFAARVVPRTTKPAPRSVVPATTQHGTSNHAAMHDVPQTHDHVPSNHVPTYSAPTERRPAAAGAPSAKPSKKPSDDGFTSARWLIAEQGNPARKQYEILADARAADAVIARTGSLDAAKALALERLAGRRTLLLWAYVLNDLKVADAAASRTNGATDETAGRHGRVSAARAHEGIRGGAGGPGAAQGESDESRLRRELQRRLRPDLYSDAGVLPGVPGADTA